MLKKRIFLFLFRDINVFTGSCSVLEIIFKAQHGDVVKTGIKNEGLPSTPMLESLWIRSILGNIIFKLLNMVKMDIFIRGCGYGKLTRVLKQCMN